MDIRNQQHTIFTNAAKAQEFIAANIAANIEDLMEGERYEIDQPAQEGGGGVLIYRVALTRHPE